MADPWCGSCGNNLLNQLHCTKCGAKATTRDGDSKQNEVLNYSQFKTKKAAERCANFKGKKIVGVPSASTKNKNTIGGGSAPKEVQIHVGIIEENKDQNLVRKRGSKIPVVVLTNDGREEVLGKALKKLGEHDQYFCRYDTYQLCYPDCTMAFKVPGSNLPFTVEGYKTKLGKPYSKIDLFVCLAVSLLEQPMYSSDPDDPDDPLSNSNNKKKDKKQEEKPPKPKTELMVVSDEGDDSDDKKNNTGARNPPKTELMVVSDEDSDDKKNKTAGAHQMDERPPISTRFGTCPVCSKRMKQDILQEHANECLNKSSLFFELQGNSHLPAPNCGEDENQKTLEAQKLNGKPFKPENQSSYIREVQKALIKCNLLEEPVIVLSVRRGFEFDDFQKFFKKAWNKKNIGHVININYLGIEVGVDTGGVSREFYSEAFSQVMQRFFRPVNSQNLELGFEPAENFVGATDGTIEAIGHLFVASLVHNGPAPNFLSPWVFDYIIGGMENINLPEDIGNPLYKKIYLAETNEEMVSLMETDEGYEMIEAIGYGGSTKTIGILSQPNILRSIFMKEKSGILNIVNNLSRGMQSYNALETIRGYVDLFRPCFTPNNVLSWEFDTIRAMFAEQYEAEGSNKKFLEINTFKAFIDFVALSFKDENCEVPSPILMKFLTGCETVPPLGIPAKEFKVYFKHTCQPSSEGKPCACLPEVSTCAFWIKLPVHISDEDNMCQSFIKAMKDGAGFHLA